MEVVLMLFDLSGRTALVTGASRGIGRAVALGLAEHGADVAVNCVPEYDASVGRPFAAEELCSAIRKLGRRALLVPGDPGVGDGPQALVKATTDVLGAVDILVVCASVQYNALYADITRAQFDHQVNLNLWATLELVRLTVPDMAERGWGRLLTIGSIQQLRPHREMAVYASLKAAQHNLCMLIAREHAAQGVTANNLAPGFIDTDRNQDVRDDPQRWQQTVDHIPMKRAGQAKDLVGAAVLLCSDAGSFITGVSLDVAGGSQMVR
jgi:NAD(P)-dependent dehydrogenase (short-subunit alcohol dehydrogenase family)